MTSLRTTLYSEHVQGMASKGKALRETIIMVDNKKRHGKDLDRIDRNILNELQKDGRISNVELSSVLGYHRRHALSVFVDWKDKGLFLATPRS